MNELKLINFKKVRAITGLSRTSAYRRINSGLFPRPAKIGDLNVWAEHEVNEINRAVLAGKSEEEIRDVVRRIAAARIAVEA